MNNLFIVIFLLAIKTVSAQKSESVTLEWKIMPGDTLSYKTIMTSIEQSEPDTAKLFGKIIPEDLKDSIQKDSMRDFKSFFKTLHQANDNLKLTSKMVNNGNGIVGVYMESNSEKQGTETNTLQNIFPVMKTIENVMLRGSVYQKRRHS